MIVMKNSVYYNNPFSKKKKKNYNNPMFGNKITKLLIYSNVIEHPHQTTKIYHIHESRAYFLSTFH